MTDNARAVADAVARAVRHAPFLRETISRYPDLPSVLADRGVAAALAQARAAGDASADLASALRIERKGVALVLALADLSGLSPFADVVEHLTRFADDALDRAIREAMRERAGDENATGFVAIALGKQGSGELNYSSDIDPIFLYDPQVISRRPREDAQLAAVRIARRVLDLLQTPTGDGYVLRVDLRLRPSPEVFPIAVALDAAIAYYESSALTWERAAFIRARAAAGDIALGSRFLGAIQPFVWRRSIDFGAIEEITALSHRIRSEHPQAQAFGPGYDLKRGRGGIREIEFFAQVHQLIHGGRDVSLQVPATRDGLSALAAAGKIDAGAANELSQAYVILRTIEHRLQMIDDRQTHSLPAEAEALAAVAGLHGLDGPEALLSLLAPHVARVAARYDALTGEAAHRNVLPDDGDALVDALHEIGFADPKPVARQIAQWRQAKARSLRSPAARTAFEAMLPGLMDAIATVADPQVTLNRFADIVERLPSGINLYRLLEARPALVDRLAQILGHAPALADQLAQRPDLLDGLVDTSILDLPPDVETLAAQWSPLLSGDDSPGSYERSLDAARRRINEWRFALGVQLISAQADPLDISAGYARIAEAAVRMLADAAVRMFAADHGHVPGGELVMVAMGRLGGGALTHASDLDLVYLFTGGTDISSDGPRPLRANDYFNRLARRVTAALSIPTAAGPLYEVDTRLRPSGVHGMLAVSLDAFAAYQASDAWTFEHMALTRARAVFGSVDARQSVESAIHDVLTRPRDPDKVIADAIGMRAEMNRAKPPAGPFDVKLGSGGLVDLEFAVHVRQLVTGDGLRPNLNEAVHALVTVGRLPPGMIDAAHLLGRMLVTLRLVAPGGGAPVIASRTLVAQACGFGDWAACVDALAQAQRAVAMVWAETPVEEK